MIAKEILLMEPIRLNRYNTVVPPQKKKTSIKNKVGIVKQHTEKKDI
jgi:hypothetical protein